MAEVVKVYGVRRSPFTCRAEIALKLKGVQYEFMEEDFCNKSPELLKYNPVHQNIPVLVHNGKPIAESAVIIMYIDETFKGDPYEKATARFWAKFIDDKLLFAIRSSFWGKGEEQEKAMKQVPEMLKTLEKQLEGKKFSGGESIGLVDIVACFIGHWLGIFEEVMGLKFVTKEKFPKLSEWMDDFLSCTSVKECLPPKDSLLEQIRNYNARNLYIANKM